VTRAGTACEDRGSTARLAAVRLGSSVLSWLLAASLLSAVLPAGGCSRKREDPDARPSELPPLSFRADTPNLMLTWIDERGGTHVEGAPDQVPERSRDFVRVVLSDRTEGTSDPIYVSDLSKPDADGGYTARSVARSVWEDEIERRRERNAEALADTPERPGPRPRRDLPMPPPERPGRPAPEPDQRDHDPKPSDPVSGVTATVYGAAWCQPCHQALDHLKRRGVKAAFKDIEKDRVAQAEMKQKLDKAGRGDGRIPVIDIDGKILVGYSARAIDAALEQAKSGTML
jgi:glutaredoxin